MSGIFMGNILGSKSMGAVEIPWQAWENAEFKRAHGKCWNLANSEADRLYKFGNPSTGPCADKSKSWCHSYFLDACVKNILDKYGPFASGQKAGRQTGAKLISSTTKSDIECNGPVSATGPCNSAPVIRYVQRATGNPNCDGVYGPETASYIAKSGKSFKQIAPKCTGSVPGTSGGGGGGGLVAAPTTEPTEMVEASMFSKIPTVAWVGAAALAGLGLVFLSAKKK